MWKPACTPHTIRDTDDVNDHAASLSLWEQRYDQLSAGRFRGRIEELCLGPLQIFREQTDQAVWQRGLSRPGTVALAVPVDAAAESWFCGRRLRAGQGFLVEADTEFELVTRGRFDVVALDVDQGFLAEYARCVEGLDDWPMSATTSGVLGDEDRGNAVLRELLLTTLRTARERPDLLAHEPMHQSLVHAACDAVLARLRGPGGVAASTPISGAGRQRVVQQARAYMLAHIDVPIGVPELCAALRVSRRTLQYSFQDVLQLSPVTCLRVLRLNGVRRELRRGGAADSVADCAARWGFWHLSRLATEYRALFGELPSRTLQQAQAEAGQAGSGGRRVSSSAARAS